MTIGKGHSELAGGHDQSGSENEEDGGGWEGEGQSLRYGDGEEGAVDRLAGEDGGAVFALMEVPNEDDDAGGENCSGEGEEVVEADSGSEGFGSEKNHEAKKSTGDPKELFGAEGFFQKHPGEDGGEDGIGEIDHDRAGGSELDHGDVVEGDADGSE